MDVPSRLLVAQRRSAELVEVVAERRELLIKAAPYGVASDIGGGITETFLRGTFAGAARDPARLSVTHPHGGSLVGRALEAEDRADGFWMRARIASTQAGEDVLTLVGEGILTQASVEFLPHRGTIQVRQLPHGGLDVTHKKGRLFGVALVAEAAHDSTLVELARDAQLDRERERLRLWLEVYRSSV